MAEITILLVEDNQAMLDGMKDLLEISDTGYDISVLPASDGRQALALMTDHLPDLIVSDVMMPNMGGYEFLDQVRQKPEWRHIPFIFVTAKGEEEDKRQGKLSSADLYITKPFVVSQLLELIRIQLDRTQARQQTQQQLADSLKKDLLQILNHEFRTPLTYVTAYYEMLADNALQAENGRDYSEYLRGIQAGNVRLSRLVEDFIMVMELRSGEAQEKFHRQARPIEDMTLLLNTIVNERREEAASLNIQLDCDSPPNLPPIWGNRRDIQNILERILDNAIKFTAAYKKRSKETSQVTVSATAVANELHITIQDEGMGLPAYALDNIFDLFVQHNRDSLEQQGAGIGLTVARGLAELHHGRIEVESREGYGSAFTVILPVYTGDSAHFPGNDVTRRDRKQANILVVEDDPLQRVGLEDLLDTYDGRYQFHIRTSANGLEGLEQIGQTVPDLIISDIMMPQMDGYQFLQTVRENPAWQHIPFIFLTAKGEKQDEFEGFRRGVDEYIVKPYDSDDMIRFVTKQLDKHFHAQMVQAQTFNELKRSIINLITPEF
ncbi:MAG TPA: response regulator, partial [Anaerolineae bacterium]|nr:response regulator [Anaerolineae bacterium]